MHPCWPSELSDPGAGWGWAAKGRSCGTPLGPCSQRGQAEEGGSFGRVAFSVSQQRQQGMKQNKQGCRWHWAHVLTSALDG